MSDTGFPMFPLGTPLLPYMFLPLRVFEPRYLVMMKRCLAGDGRFGVVLIRQGREVGGGDVRHEVGTVARIVDGRSGPAGLQLSTVGEERITITRWLPDDPYPMASVEPWPDGDSLAADDTIEVKRVLATLRRVLARKAELGEPAVSSTVELAEDPAVALWQACACAPVPAEQRHALLVTPGASERLRTLARWLDEADGVLSRRLGG